MKKSTCDDLSVYMYTFTSESDKHCTRLSRRNEQLELSEEFDGGNRCVSTDELNKSSIVVDDGFFGTSATSCGIWCCCLSQYGKDMFFHWIWLTWHSGELIGEHIAYPQAWHSKVACLHHFTQLSLHISHDFSRLPFFFHMFRISCQSYAFLRLFLKASRVDPTSTLKLHLGLWGLGPSVSQCVPVSQCVQAVPVCLSAMKLAAVCQDTATPRCPCDVLVMSLSFFRNLHKPLLRLAVVGDDAATGHGAADYNGWAAQMGKMLHEEFGATLSLHSCRALRCMLARRALCSSHPLYLSLHQGYGFYNCAEMGLSIQVSCCKFICACLCRFFCFLWFWSHTQSQEAFKRGLANMLPKPAPEAQRLEVKRIEHNEWLN